MGCANRAYLRHLRIFTGVSHLPLFASIRTQVRVLSSPQRPHAKLTAPGCPLGLHEQQRIAARRGGAGKGVGVLFQRPPLEPLGSRIDWRFFQNFPI